MQHTTSRRAFIAGAAVSPALAAATLTLAGATALALSGPDPIYAAIDRHKAANMFFSEELRGMSDFEERDVSADSAEHEEWERRENEAAADEREACDEMIATAPTTLPGLLALLRYVEKEHARGEKFLDQDGLEELLSTTVTALAGIGAVS